QKDRKQIETRLRKGIPKRRIWNRESYLRLRAYSIVERLSWLKEHGCQFSFDVDAVLAKERTVIPPDWTEADGSHAADSVEGRSGGVYTDSSHNDFVDTPIDVLVERALQAYDRRHNSVVERNPYAFLVERNPYSGLAKARPLRVLAALRRLSKADATAKQGWTQFLQSAARQNDKPRLAALIARRLVTIQPALLDELVLVAAHWLELNAKRLFEVDRDVAQALFDRLLEAIAEDLNGSLQKITSVDTERDWLEDTWSSAVRPLVEVVFADTQLTGVELRSVLPAEWTRRADALRNLPGDYGLFALTQFAQRLCWLYAHDPAWTERTVIAPIDRDSNERDAALAGFFSNATRSPTSLSAGRGSRDRRWPFATLPHGRERCRRPRGGAAPR